MTNVYTVSIQRVQRNTFVCYITSGGALMGTGVGTDKQQAFFQARYFCRNMRRAGMAP